MPEEIQFQIGEIVHHQKFNYRGVIYDVDPHFAASEEWYDQVAQSRPPKDKPWYHVLVDGSDHTTYVAERHLKKDESAQPIRHPMLGHYFDHFKDGCYGRVVH